jgi:methionine sulfoxide reductase heme-binding subunit
MSPAARRRGLKTGVFIACSIPLAWLGWAWSLVSQDPYGGALGGPLGVNPIEATTHFLGIWALRLLMLTLAVAPLVKMFRWTQLMAVRRMIGLFAFAYVTLHLLSYAWLDLLWAWDAIWADVRKRYYIMAGFGAFLLLIPLAVTSTNGWIRRLGARRWQQVHKLVYPAALLAALHFMLKAKGFQPEPLIYLFLTALLLAFRVPGLQPRPVAAKGRLKA